MNKRTEKAIRQDFLDWTGGFEPESEHQIFVYVELARPFDTDSEEVRRLLLAWLQGEAVANDPEDG